MTLVKPISDFYTKTQDKKNIYHLHLGSQVFWLVTTMFFWQFQRGKIVFFSSRLTFGFCFFFSLGRFRSGPWNFHWKFSLAQMMNFKPHWWIGKIFGEIRAHKMNKMTNELIHFGWNIFQAFLSEATWYLLFLGLVFRGFEEVKKLFENNFFSGIWKASQRKLPPNPFLLYRFHLRSPLKLIFLDLLDGDVPEKVGFQKPHANSHSNSPVVMNVLLTSINLSIMIAVSESMGACFLRRGNDPLKATGEGWLVMLPPAVWKNLSV